MSIASRKEKEFKAREELILETSYEMIIELGYIGFTIDKLAKKIDYAKGTIYKHFSCKEDIIAKLLYNILFERIGIIKRGLELDLPPRIKFLVSNIGVSLFHKLNPDMHKLIHISYVGSIWNKTRDELRKEHSEVFLESFRLFNMLYVQAEEIGDLIPGEHCPADVFYSVISLIIGYDRLASTFQSCEGDLKFTEMFNSELSSSDIQRLLKLNIDTYLDGLGWKPLSNSEGYHDVVKKNVRELYGDLLEKLGK